MPEAALRDGVLNAIVHIDYASGVPVQISIYADKLMIWNPGQLPPAWTVEKLKGKHASHSFNPDIAHVFFRAGEIEAWGRGVERIFAACRDAGFPEPQIEQEPAGLWISFPFAPDIVRRTEAAKTSGKASGKRLSKTARAMVDWMLKSPQITIPELAKKLDRFQRVIELQINKLKEGQVIGRVGPAHGGHWEVKE